MKTAKHKIIRCHRCNRRIRRIVEPGRGEWNAFYRLGTLTAYLCPDCQTPEENAEAVIKDATGETSGSSDGVMTNHSWVANAEIITQALSMHTEHVWRDWLMEIASGDEEVSLDLPGLTDRAWDTLPDPWRSMAASPDAVAQAKAYIFEHLNWLFAQASGRQT